jgi:hypothetical protein
MSGELAWLVASDPAADVRSAAAARCTDLPTLAAAWKAEADAGVRAVLAGALASALADPHDRATAEQTINATECTDAIRAEVARRASDGDLRRLAIAAIGDDATLYDLAIGAPQADTRIAAAERIAAVHDLTRLAEAAKQRDHGVAKVARQRPRRDGRDQAQRRRGSRRDPRSARSVGPAPGTDPLRGRRVESPLAAARFERRQRALARCEAARQGLQTRFDREHDEQTGAHALRTPLEGCARRDRTPGRRQQLDAIAAEIAALRTEAETIGDVAGLAAIAEAEQKVDGWKRELAAQANAEVLVIEAEGLAADTSIDNAKLPERWQALDRAIRTPALTRRFEAALTVIEQRRLAQVQAAQQEASAARARVHALLISAEQGLAAGQLQAARAAADEIKGHKINAGLLPKPTVQRIGRLAHQLTELERWETFGQQNARVQLCERAEALASPPLDAPQLAKEVQKLRNEWKALDQQYAGVPKTLWERFDHACEKAYAPAAKHFAEQAAMRKEVRKKRDDFIAAAAARVPDLLVEPRDWRAIERYMRDTDQAWREGGLGSVDPDMWKKLDARLKEAIAPLREAVNAARAQARDARKQLIADALAVGAKALDRDAPAQIKAIQAKWQEQAKQMTLAPRDERTLLGGIPRRLQCGVHRARCEAQGSRRSQEREPARARGADASRRKRLRARPPASEQEVRRTLREMQDQWRARSGKPEPGMPALEARFRNARNAVETLAWHAGEGTRGGGVAGACRQGAPLRRARSRRWRLRRRDRRRCAEGGIARPRGSASRHCLPHGSASSPRAAIGALAALGDPATRAAYASRVAEATTRDASDCSRWKWRSAWSAPPKCSRQRLALQVQQLRDRFQSAAKSEAQSPIERLVAWCAEPGVADTLDRERSERIFAAVPKRT